MVIKPLEGEGDSQGKKSAKLYLTLNTRKEKSPTALLKNTLLTEKCVQAKTDTTKIFLHYEYLTCLKGLLYIITWWGPSLFILTMPPQIEILIW